MKVVRLFLPGLLFGLGVVTGVITLPLLFGIEVAGLCVLLMRWAVDGFVFAGEDHPNE